MGAPLAPRSSTLAPLLCYLPRSPPRRIPAAAGLQPRHGPNALLTAAGTDASPAASGKSRADSVFPGARLPPPHSAWPWLPCVRQPGLCFHGGTFPRASGHREGTGGQGRERLEEAGRLVRTEAPAERCPAGAVPSEALTLAQFCWGLTAGPETNPSAEKATDPAWGSAECQELPSLYSGKVLSRQAGA